jgi:hypothetical protein
VLQTGWLPYANFMNSMAFRALRQLRPVGDPLFEPDGAVRDGRVRHQQGGCSRFTAALVGRLRGRPGNGGGDGQRGLRLDLRLLGGDGRPPSPALRCRR